MLRQFFQTKYALGSDTTLVLVSDQPESAIEAVFAVLWSIIFNFERRFSRFLPSSELSIFNRLGGQRTPISAEFRKLLLVSRELSKKTKGLYNPFILPALQRAGYVKSFSKKYADVQGDNYSSRLVVPISELKIGEDWATIPYGAALDTGGCGKGYLADLLAEAMPAEVPGFWFSLGGDIVAYGHDEKGEPWEVGIQDANDASNLNKWLVRGSGGLLAVATSGVNVRKGHHNGMPWHHIIDPRTEEPAITDTVVATVQATTAVEADVLASCAIILGSQKALPFLRSHGVLASVLQTISKEGEPVDVQFGKHLVPGNQKKILANA